MSDSNWGGRIAVVGSCLAILVIVWGLSVSIYSMGWASGLHQVEANDYTAKYPADTDSRIEKCLSDGFGSDAKKCVEEAIESSHESQRSEQDLQAQRDMSEWAWWLLIVSLVQVPLGVGGLIVLLVTIGQGREALAVARMANETNKTIGERQARAYVSFHHISISYIELIEKFTINLTLKNAGASPALKMVIDTDCTIGHQPEFQENQRDLFDLPSDSSQTYPVEILRPIIKPDQLHPIKIITIKIKLTGEDVFGHVFTGKVTAFVLCDNEHDWKRGLDMMLTVVENPRYSDDNQ